MELTREQQQALAKARARQRLSSGQADDFTHPNSPLSTVRTGVAGFVEGIPVAGPLLRRGAEMAAAATVAPFSDLTYSEALEHIDKMNAEEKAANPIVDVGSQIAGGTAALAPLAATAPVAKALGLTGSALQRGIAGAFSGFGIAGADSVARGGDIQDAWKPGLFGAGIGGTGAVAAPYLARGASALGNKALRLLGLQKQSASQPAVELAARGLARDGIDPQTIGPRLNQIGPDAVVADLGPNVTRQAAAVASLPGRGQALARDAVVSRNVGRNTRIQGSVDDILGAAPVPSQVQEQIRAGQQALSPDYERALAQAQPVDTRGLAQRLEGLGRNLRGEAQRAANRVREMLNIPGAAELDNNPRVLLETRHAIDGMMDSATDRNVRRVLTEARGEIDNILSTSVPGIKQVDARFAELARQNEAVTTGQQVLSSGKTAPRPAEVQDLAQSGALPEGAFTGPSGAAFRLSQGARAEIDRIIGNTGNNLTGLKSALKGDGSWNRDRLVTLFGKDKADDLLRVLDRETIYQRTYDTIVSNSETAARVAAQQEVAPTTFGERSIGLADILLRVPQKAANTAARSRSEKVNSALVDALMSRPTPDLIDQLSVARAMLGREGARAPFVPATVSPVTEALLGNVAQ